MAHSLAPGFIEVTYTVSALLHKMRVPVQPDVGWGVGLEPNLVTKNGASISLSAAMTELLAVVRPFFHTSVDFLAADAWFTPTGGTDPIWVYTHPLGVQGTSSTVATFMSQVVMSFRTLIGGIAKIYMMEASVTINNRVSYPFGAGSSTNLATYMTGSTSIWRGRDDSVLVVPMWQTTKTNDAIRKKRLNM